MLHNQFVQSVQLVGRKTDAACQFPGAQPEFCHLATLVNMNVRRLVGLVAVEVKPVGSNP